MQDIADGESTENEIDAFAYLNQVSARLNLCFRGIMRRRCWVGLHLMTTLIILRCPLTSGGLFLLVTGMIISWKVSADHMTENQAVGVVPILCQSAVYRPDLSWKVATGPIREVSETIMF